jgi:hypothetical protein
MHQATDLMQLREKTLLGLSEATDREWVLNTHVLGEDIRRQLVFWMSLEYIGKYLCSLKDRFTVIYIW